MLDELKQRISQGESDTLEFKTSTAQLKSAMETLCAFLNYKGGHVLMGVANDGKMVGQEVTDNTRQEISREISKIEPPAQIDIDYMAVGHNKQVIILRVPASNHAPYTYDGRAFHRRTSTTCRMPQHQYEQLLKERGQLDYVWEEVLVPDYTIDMLDQNEIRRMVEESVQANRMTPEALNEKVPQILQRLKLIKNGQIKRAAIVLFSKEEFLEFPQCMIKMAHFHGRDKLGDYIDNQQVSGNAFQLLREADIFLRRNLLIASVFNPEQFKRIDKPALPVLAVREALINALIHRDYSNRATAISLAIFDDRLEIWNNGNLPHELTVEDLKLDHDSLPRNKLIAKVFYNCQFIETWGTGTNRMVELCKQEGIPEPQFELRSGGLAVIFKFKETLARVTNQSKRTIKEEAISLTPRQQEILTILQQGKELSAAKINNELNSPLAARTLRDELAALKKLDLIGSRGRGSHAVWFRIMKVT